MSLDSDTQFTVVSLITLTQHAAYTCSMAPTVALTLHADVDIVNGPLRWHVLSGEETLIPAEPGDTVKQQDYFTRLKITLFI